MNQKGLSKKMFKCVWQVVETIFLPQKSLFFVETCKNFEFFIFFRILLVQVEENYTKNNDLQYFFVSDKNCERFLASRWGTSTAERSTRFPKSRLMMRCCMSHKFFFELQIYKKISPKLCLVNLFISLPKTLRKNRWISAFQSRPLP